eukprot:3350697-Pleurochrysis_carterae.AAC.1
MDILKSTATLMCRYARTGTNCRAHACPRSCMPTQALHRTDARISLCTYSVHTPTHTPAQIAVSITHAHTSANSTQGRRHSLHARASANSCARASANSCARLPRILRRSPATAHAHAEQRLRADSRSRMRSGAQAPQEMYHEDDACASAIVDA